MKIQSIETERLIGRGPTSEDVMDMGILFRDPQVAKTLTKDGQPVTDDELIATRLARAVKHWEEHGFGYAMFYHREDQRFVGRGGLAHYKLDGKSEIELGYAVASAEWRQGYATEIARAWLEIAFQQMGLTSVIAFTLPTNLGSRKVMEGVGFNYERDFVHAELDHVLYRLSR